jgi:hypothetical protein
MDETKHEIHIETVKGFVQGDYTTVNITESNYGQIDWHARLPLACHLLLESFKLGDYTAAKFPYVIVPVQDIYNAAIQALHNVSSETNTVKRGILVLGESNAGKTRLALETLRKTLPNWPVLHWRPDYNIHHAPPVDFIKGKHLIVFIDDLQDYVSTQLQAMDNQDLYSFMVKMICYYAIR